MTSKTKTPPGERKAKLPGFVSPQLATYELNQFFAASSIKTERFRISPLSTIRVLEPLNCRKCNLELKYCRKCSSEKNRKSTE